MNISVIQPLTADSLHWINELNEIIRLASQAKSLVELSSKLKSKKYWTIEYGFGSSHCWIKQKDINGNLNENNTLLITE